MCADLLRHDINLIPSNLNQSVAIPYMWSLQNVHSSWLSGETQNSSKTIFTHLICIYIYIYNYIIYLHNIVLYIYYIYTILYVMITISIPIGSMYAIYVNIYHQYTPFMLAYIPAPWILRMSLDGFPEAAAPERSLPSALRRSGWHKTPGLDHKKNIHI